MIWEIDGNRVMDGKRVGVWVCRLARHNSGRRTRYATQDGQICLVFMQVIVAADMGHRVQ